MRNRRRIGLLMLGLFCHSAAYCWGFYAHARINELAVFLLPPDMMVFYKPHIRYLAEHATDPDKRRYLIPEEGPRHYLDLDYYGHFPFPELPRSWNEAVACYGEDTLKAHGLVPWHVPVVLRRLTKAFAEGHVAQILQQSAELGHYVADAHVPLHASSNHNGQLTGQQGIHGFWESRIPELLAEKEFDFLIGRAAYIADPSDYIWNRLLESAAASDSVLHIEKQLSLDIPESRQFAFEERNGKWIRQYSSYYTREFDRRMGGMVERRMRQSVFSVASYWYTAWVNAGQPDLRSLTRLPVADSAAGAEYLRLQRAWKEGVRMIGRDE